MTRVSLIYGFWMAGLILEGLLLGLLLAKKVQRSFPLFTLYIGFDFAHSVGAWILFHYHASAYLYYFYSGQVVRLSLAFAVIYEIFKHLFRPYTALQRISAISLQWIAILLVIAGGWIIYSHPSPTRFPLLNELTTFEEATRVGEVGILMFLFLFSNAFSLHWRKYVFGIALGLGLLGTIQLVTIATRAQLGTMLNVVWMSSFDLTLLIWLGYFLAPEPATKPAELPQHSQLEQWNRALTEFLYQ